MFLRQYSIIGLFMLLSPNVWAENNQPSQRDIDSNIEKMINAYKKGSQSISKVEVNAISEPVTFVEKKSNKETAQQPVMTNEPLRQEQVENSTTPVFKKDETAPVVGESSTTRNQMTASLLNSPVLHLPPSTRFTFSKNLFVPAYTKSTVFLPDGRLVNMKTDNLESALVALQGKFEKQVCGLSYSKSYMMFRGVEENEKHQTFIDVQNISVLDQEGSALIQIAFKPKLTEKENVEITIKCAFPKLMLNAEDTDTYYTVKVHQLIEAVPYFNIKKPQFLEL